MLWKSPSICGFVLPVPSVHAHCVECVVVQYSAVECCRSVPSIWAGTQAVCAHGLEVEKGTYCAFELFLLYQRRAHATVMLL